MTIESSASSRKITPDFALAISRAKIRPPTKANPRKASAMSSDMLPMPLPTWTAEFSPWITRVKSDKAKVKARNPR